jgi:HPt (histidine-containing phosphotransfer) domain-containing protein
MDMTTQHPSDNHGDLTAAAPGADDELGEATRQLDETILNRLRALDPLGGNQLVKRVIGAYQLSLAHGLAQLQAAGKIDDLNSVRQVVHTLKSSSANVGANQLSQCCAELESLIRIDQVDNLQHRIEGLCREINWVAQALKALLESQT